MTSAHVTFLALVGVTLAGQLAGVAYEILVADRFGTGPHADALALALTVVVAMANEIMTWVSTLFIPHYVEVRERTSEASASAFFHRVLTVLSIGTLGVAVMLAFAAPAFVQLLAPRLAARGEGVGLLRLFVPLLIVLPLSVLLSGVLQAHGHFILAGARQCFWYGTAFIAMVILGRNLGPLSIPVGMTIGIAVFCALLARYLYQISPARQVPGVTPRLRAMLRLLAPLVLASCANYVNVMFERAIAARQPPGSLAALTYAFRLLNFPLNLFVWNATAMLLPTLAGHAARNDAPTIEALLRRALRLSLVFTVLLAALAISLAEPAVRILLERGAFTATSTAFTATALACYAPAVIGIAGAQVLSRAYQALKEVGRMVSRGVAVIVLNLALMPLLAALLGFAGLAVATSVTALALYGVMLAGIRHRLPGLTVGSIWSSAWRAGVAGGATVALIWTLRVSGFESGIPMLAALLLSGAATYAVVLFLLSREDARLALAFVLPMLTLRAPGRS